MAYQIFLSSCFDREMQQNREIFRADLIARFNELSGQYGQNVFITDYEYGIPDGLTVEQIINICVSNVKDSDLFLCILGSRYGFQINKSRVPAYLLNFRDLMMPEANEDDHISFLEIEILTALLFIPEKATFFVCDTGNREPSATRLLDALSSYGTDINFFSSMERLTELSINRFSYYSGYMYCETPNNQERASVCSSVPLTSDHSQNGLTISQKQYLSRKLRYSIPAETMLNQISAYTNGNSTDTFVLVGAHNCGKSMILAEWVRQNMHREDIAIHCWFHEEGAGLLSVVLMDLLSNKQETANFFYQDDAVHTFYQTATQRHDIKQIFILDGIDHLDEAREAGWLITSTDPSVKVIITLNHNLAKYLPKNHVISADVSPISVQSLIRHIYELEGKGLEYPQMQTVLKDVCKEWSLRQAANGIQQFLRIMKYQPGSSKADWDTSEIREYLKMFSSTYGVFKNTQNYLEMHFSSATVHKSISLLALSERGLARNELSDMMQGRIEIFYQLYYILVVC